jgi:hypothetical protein
MVLKGGVASDAKHSLVPTGGLNCAQSVELNMDDAGDIGSVFNRSYNNFEPLPSMHLTPNVSSPSCHNEGMFNEEMTMTLQHSNTGGDHNNLLADEISTCMSGSNHRSSTLYLGPKRSNNNLKNPTFRPSTFKKNINTPNKQLSSH